jgi:hypothetical protein
MEMEQATKGQITVCLLVLSNLHVQFRNKKLVHHWIGTLLVVVLHIAEWRLYVHMRRTRARARTREYEYVPPSHCDRSRSMRACRSPPRPGSNQGTTPPDARALGQRVDSNDSAQEAL